MAGVRFLVELCLKAALSRKCRGLKILGGGGGSSAILIIVIICYKPPYPGGGPREHGASLVTLRDALFSAYVALLRIDR